MPPRFERDDAAARGAGNEALLQEIRLDDLLDRIARLRQSRRNRLDADRAAVMRLGNARQIAVVERIEALVVDLERGQRLVGEDRVTTNSNSGTL